VPLSATQFDDISASTLKLVEKHVIDSYFLATPLQRYILDHCQVPWNGGSLIQNQFLLQGTAGGAFTKGDDFDTTQRNFIDEKIFTIKLYYENITLDLIDSEVFNRGPLAVLDLADIQMQAAVLTQSARMAVAMSLHGQANTTGIVGNRPKEINGWIEALNDGVTPGWDGSYFTSYGNRSRANDTLINSVPYFGGNSDGTTAPISYQVMEETYQDCVLGAQGMSFPDLGVTNKALFAYMKEKMQPQQRFAQEADPIWGFPALRFNEAHILVDNYFPSLKYGQSTSYGNFLTGTFTSPATVGSTSNMPTSTTINVGEVFCWFTTSRLKWYVTNGLFGGEFRGFIAENNNTRLSGQLLLAANLIIEEERAHRQLFGFGA
jgi:hypothetical protein